MLASDLGSLPECVLNGETGYRFPAGDAAGLAKRLEHCLDHPQEMVMMARKARRAAETVYSPEGHVQTLERLFDDLVSRK